MSDDSSDTSALERAFVETVALKTALRAAIEKVTVERAEADGHPVHPDVLAGLLLAEVGAISVQWGLVLNRSPFEIEDYHDGLLRRARRGLQAQITQAFSERGKRIVTS